MSAKTANQNVYQRGLVPLPDNFRILSHFTILLLLVAALFLPFRNAGAVGENSPSVPAVAAPAVGEAHRSKAEAGDALAQAILADALYHGLPSDKAFVEAASWAEKASAQGCPVGTAILADMFRTGKGRPLDEKKAEELAEASRELLLAGTASANPVWLRWAALSPPRRSKYLDMGTGLREGNVSHWARNLPLMRQAIVAGDVQAAVEWAKQLHTWKIEGQEEEDRKRVINTLEKARAEGYPAAMHALGELYDWGIVLPKDEAKAETCYTEAVAAGYGPSRLALAKLIAKNGREDPSRVTRLAKLQEESIIPENSALAALWFYELETGETLPRDSVKAAEWLARLEPSQAAVAIAGVIKGVAMKKLSAPTKMELDALFERMERSSPTAQAYRLIQTAGLFFRETTGDKWYMRAAMSEKRSEDLASVSNRVHI